MRAGISGSGGAEAATCGDGVVLQAEAASAESAMVDQTRVRFRIDEFPLTPGSAA